MFGTGEWASSASESTKPSWTSSSWRSGTYCRQMGSPGVWMRSTMAGEMRNSKFSAACRRRARSGKCSGPNLATSASSEAMLRLRSSCCQDSMRQILEIDHQVVAGGVIAGDRRHPRVAASLIELARAGVVRAGRGLDDEEPSVVARELLLDRGQQLDPAREGQGVGTELLTAVEQQLGPDALALACRVDDDPVEVIGAFGAGCRTPAGVADQLVGAIRAQEAVVIVTRQAVVEQLRRDRDLRRPEQAGGRRELLKPCALRAADGTERGAHGQPWRPALRAARPRRYGAPARRNPSRPRAPCGTGRRRR